MLKTYKKKTFKFERLRAELLQKIVFRDNHGQTI